MQTTTPALNDTAARKSFLRGDARFGRTTRLVEKATGRVLFEAAGACSRGDLFRAWLRHAAK